MKTQTAIISGLAVLILFAAVVREEPWLFLVGWMPFLWHNLQNVTVNPVGVATGVAAFVLLLGMTHYIGRWWRLAMPSGSDGPQRQWRFRWSLSVVIVVVVMFAAGFSAIGLARQLGWLLSSTEATYVERVDVKLED
jgi:hypothetical protein